MHCCRFYVHLIVSVSMKKYLIMRQVLDMYTTMLKSVPDVLGFFADRILNGYVMCGKLYS